MFIHITFVEGLDLDGDRVAGLRCRGRGGGSEVLEARAETLCMYIICILLGTILPTSGSFYIGHTLW